MTVRKGTSRRACRPSVPGPPPAQLPAAAGAGHHMTRVIIEKREEGTGAAELAPLSARQTQPPAEMDGCMHAWMHCGIQIE